MPQNHVWPYQCLGCGEFNYNSPKPVVVLVLRALTPTGDAGVIVVRRGIQPGKGGWAFPGGYVDYQEDWADAAIREAKEELGIDIDPKWIMPWGPPVTTKTNFFIQFVTVAEVIFGAKPWKGHDITKCLNDSGEQEVLEIRVISPTETMKRDFHLAFDAHERIWQRM